MSLISSEKNINSLENTNTKLFKSRNDTFISYSKGKLSKKPNANSNFFPNYIYSQSIIPKPGLVGLSSKKFPYSLNSIIQSLSNIKRLRNYLLSKNNYENFLYKKNEGMKLTFALSKIFKNIWETQETISKRIYDPLQLKTEFLNMLHNNKSYDNPIEVLKILLYSINKELQENKAKNFNNLQTIQKTNNISINNYNQANNSLMKKFNENKTIISDEFCLIQKSAIICNYCKNKISQINQVYNLAFNIEEIIKFINKKNKNIKIGDCFNFFMHQESKILCPVCKMWRKIFIQKNFISLPGTIIICFDKKNSIQKCKIQLEEQLNFLRNDHSEYCYNLIAVIIESSKYSYIAYCKNSYDNKWYKYQDENVGESSFNEISLIVFPLVLFYSTNNKLDKK